MKPNNERMLTAPEAAEYLQIDKAYLTRQIYHGSGPACVMPSPKTFLFTKKDLDRWRKGWKVLAAA